MGILTLIGILATVTIADGQTKKQKSKKLFENLFPEITEKKIQKIQELCLSVTHFVKTKK